MPSGAQRVDSDASLAIHRRSGMIRVIPSRLIAAKRDGEELAPSELARFFDGYAQGDVSDHQMSAFLMAVVFNGLSVDELDVLVDRMISSGAVLDLTHLPGPRVDKHSTGGVGDKVSLPLAALAAELGMYVPMMSGRGLGYSGGTLDKLDSIPGFRTNLSLVEFIAVLEVVGCAMIGQTTEIAPLDRRLYGLRDVTGTVPAIPLITSSIMSKKLSEGLTGLVLDVKVGSGAFIQDPDRSVDLARTMVGVGEARGVVTHALLTAMDRPLGRAIGNVLEVQESIECLRGEGPPDLREVVLAQAAEMAWISDTATSVEDGLDRARAALDSGRALERFRALVERQGGDPACVDEPDRLPSAPCHGVATATRGGTVQEIAPRPIGWGVINLGGGRKQSTDVIDPRVGFRVTVSVGDEVRDGDPVGEVFAKDEGDLAVGEAVLREAVKIGDGKPTPLPLIMKRVSSEGVGEYAGA